MWKPWERLANAIMTGIDLRVYLILVLPNLQRYGNGIGDTVDWGTHQYKVMNRKWGWLNFLLIQQDLECRCGDAICDVLVQFGCYHHRDKKGVSPSYVHHHELPSIIKCKQIWRIPNFTGARLARRHKSLGKKELSVWGASSCWLYIPSLSSLELSRSGVYYP